MSYPDEVYPMHDSLTTGGNENAEQESGETFDEIKNMPLTPEKIQDLLAKEFAGKPITVIPSDEQMKFVESITNEEVMDKDKAKLSKDDELLIDLTKNEPLLSITSVIRSCDKCGDTLTLPIMVTVLDTKIEDDSPLTVDSLPLIVCENCF